MRRWSYTLMTLGLVLGALLIEHSPAGGAEAEPAAAQEAEDEFVPTEKLPADAAISFPVDI